MDIVNAQNNYLLLNIEAFYLTIFVIVHFDKVMPTFS